MESYSYGFSSWLARLAGLTFALAVYLALHRRFWSPLALVPGPRLASITRLCHAYHIFKGDNSTWTRALHKQYGHFVRIAPNEVSVSHPDGPALILQASLRKVSYYETHTPIHFVSLADHGIQRGTGTASFPCQTIDMSTPRPSSTPRSGRSARDCSPRPS